MRSQTEPSVFDVKHQVRENGGTRKWQHHQNVASGKIKSN